jgi:hypothetical protein
MRILTLLALGAAIVGSAFTGSPFGSTAYAANDLCGQTITQSLTLTADQTCTGDGLIVSGDGITIDLGGFTLSGDGDPGDDGIDVSAAGRVTIKNGTIRNFDAGVASHVSAPDLVKVSKVTLRGNDFGLNATAALLVVDKCSATENGVGLFANGENVKITATAVVGNALGGIGLNADAATVAKVVSSGNGGHGLELAAGGSKVVIQSSLFTRNAMDGVFIAEAPLLPGTIKLTQSTIIGNGGHGVRTTGSDDPQHLVTVTIANNVIEANAAGGVEVTNDSDGTVVAGNRIIGNGSDAVDIDATSDAAIVKGNTSIGNNGAGIFTSNASATLAKNTLNANDNAIVASNGAIDGGGNTARANVDQSCSPSIACPPTFTPKAGPVTPTCGMHVTSSITLGADTPVCSTNGLIVDADDVTINLNGHRIRGNGNNGTVGILVPELRQHVTIANGIVQGFEVGMFPTFGVDGLKLTNIEMRDNLHSGAILEGERIAVDKSAFVNNGEHGLVVNSGKAPKVKSSIFFGNGLDGIATGVGAQGAALTKIVSAGNGEAGVESFSVSNSKLERSVIAANFADGVRLAAVVGVSAPAAVSKSIIVGNAEDGVVVTADTVGVIFDGNVSGGNGGHGIALQNHPDHTTLKKNQLIGNVRDGLFVDVPVQTTAIVQNAAVSNGVSGFNVDNATSTLTKNLAVANLASGIRTPSGASDGGGNQAHDNLASPQCTPPIACP